MLSSEKYYDADINAIKHYERRMGREEMICKVYNRFGLKTAAEMSEQSQEEVSHIVKMYKDNAKE